MSEQARLHMLVIVASLVLGGAVAAGSDDSGIGVAWWGWIAAAVAGIAASAPRRAGKG